jgi:hypothetical protein
LTYLIKYFSNSKDIFLRDGIGLFKEKNGAISIEFFYLMLRVSTYEKLMTDISRLWSSITKTFN